MDADLSHDPDALPALVAPLSEGFDLVVGSRYVPGGSIPNWRWHRRLLSQGGNLYAALLLGLHITDSTSGFRAYRAEILRRMDLAAVRAEGYGFQIEMVHEVLRARGPGDRGAHPVRRPGEGEVEDVHAHRGRGPGPRDLVGPGAGGARPAPAEGRRPHPGAPRLAPGGWRRRRRAIRGGPVIRAAP